MAFLVPTFLWHNLEGGRIASLGLDEVRENYHELERWRLSVDSFVVTLRQNNWYLTKFLFCEVVLETKVIRMFPNISQSRRRPLLGPSPG